MSKGYTLSYFISEIKAKVSTKDNTSEILKKLSPRYGLHSVKFDTLSDWLGCNFGRICEGKGKYQGFGKTPRTRLLRALRLRKKMGFNA